MDYASNDLMHEHEAILFSLKILDQISYLIESGNDVSSADIIKLIDFLKLFADKCHHGKEEDLFFPALEEAGIQRHNGPIGMMLSEHQTGREFIRSMQMSVSDNKIDKGEFVKSARGYTALLRTHIEKENTILFPIAEMKLSAQKHKDLLAEFEKFEENVIGKGKHEELHKQLKEFNKKYLK